MSPALVWWSFQSSAHLGVWNSWISPESEVFLRSLLKNFETMEHLSMIWACCYGISCLCICLWFICCVVLVAAGVWSPCEVATVVTPPQLAPACHRGHQWDRQLQHWGNPTNVNTIERLLFFCVKLCSFAQLSCLWKPEKLLVTGSCSSPPPLHSASGFVCETFSGGNWSDAL